MSDNVTTALRVNAHNWRWPDVCLARAAVRCVGELSHGVGRGCGVGRGRGVGVGLGVGVAVGVAVGVTVGVGVGVGPQGLTGQLKISIESKTVTPSAA